MRISRSKQPYGVSSFDKAFQGKGETRGAYPLVLFTQGKVSGEGNVGKKKKAKKSNPFGNKDVRERRAGSRTARGRSH